MAKIGSFKHKGDKRAHIPSKEEAGAETANEAVKKKTEVTFLKNPIVHRGQDPELFWLNKYGNDDRDDLLTIDIRSLYRHEHVSPELLIRQLHEVKNNGNEQQLNMFELFGNTLKMDELEKVADYYKWSDDWKNRLIQGDSLLVMTSLLEREGMAGKVQTIYFDPPYGIKYGSNWQMKLNSRHVKDGSDDHLTGEPEMIKAFRDTWELGIHSYLSYLRDRLLVAKELLTESGSCFVQISDENVHLVRIIMDEVFGSENFVSQITIQKTSAQTTELLPPVSDYLIFYAKSKSNIKYRQLFEDKIPGDDPDYKGIETSTGERKVYPLEVAVTKYLSGEGRLFRFDQVTSQTGGETSQFEFELGGKKYRPAGSRGWSTSRKGLENLVKKNRIIGRDLAIAYIRYHDDYPVSPIRNIWQNVALSSRSEDKYYVVQTSIKTIQRCVLLTTDPGDIVLDPTCGSGTTAFVAEQWGRKWITIDTSRIALNIAKTRLMTSVFPYYHLYDQQKGDIRQGFIYKKVPHITLRSLANDEPADEETLFDQPQEDKKKLRVAGPFTVETLQNFEPLSPDAIDHDSLENESVEQFEEKIFEHLKSAGVKNGIKNEQAVFIRVERRGSAYLHAEGFYKDSADKERKAYLHIGPKFGTVSKQAVNEAVKECRAAGDANWLIILGFSFESDISNQNVTMSAGSFEVTKVRIHDDLLQEGLLKKDKKAASFVTIGEPDVQLHKSDKEVIIEICGLDIYDPIKDEVKSRSIADIAYWMVDDDYDSSNFIVRQVFFCGGDKDEFQKWKKGLSDLAKSETKKKAEKTLKIEIDEKAFDRLYGFKSHPIEYKKGKKVAVRVISQFGEESTKIMAMG